MPGHFNAPPNWPVPSGWEPPPEWEPDPTWPAAPPGWQFWVDVEPSRKTEPAITGWDMSEAPPGSSRAGEWGWEEGRELETRSCAPRQNRNPIVAVVVGGAVAVVLVPLIGLLIWKHLHPGDVGEPAAGGPIGSSTPTSQWVSVPTTPPPVGPVLDGVYRVDLNFAARKINGVVDPAPNRSAWWAYRSACKPTGCVATATMLDANLNQNTGSPGSTDVFRFVGDHWEDPPTPYPGKVSCPGGGSAGVTMLGHSSWYPQPDGTFQGVQVADVQTPTCGVQGEAFEVPFTATRIGDVPPGVVVADPALVGN